MTARDFSSSTLSGSIPKQKNRVKYKHQMRTTCIIPFLKKVYGLPQTKKRWSSSMGSGIKNTSSASCPTNPLLPSFEREYACCKQHHVIARLVSLPLYMWSTFPRLLLLPNSCSSFDTQSKWQQVWLQFPHRPMFPQHFVNAEFRAGSLALPH